MRAIHRVVALVVMCVLAVGIAGCSGGSQQSSGEVPGEPVRFGAVLSLAGTSAPRDAIEQTSVPPGYGGSLTYSPTDHNGRTTDDLALYCFEGGRG